MRNHTISSDLPRRFQFSDYFLAFNIRENDLVTPCPRVSSFPQSSKESLTQQYDILCYAIEAYGGIVIPAKWSKGLLGSVWCGYDPYWIMPALDIMTKYNSYPLLESVDRGIRHSNYHSEFFPNLEASEYDVKGFMEVIKPFKPMVLIHPNTPLDRVRAYQSRRGEFIVKAMSNRERTKRNVLGLIKLLSQHGLSSRAIAKVLNKEHNSTLSHMTIHNYLDECKKSPRD